MNASPSPSAVRAAFWRDGDLEYLLHDGTTDPARGQRGVFRSFVTTLCRVFLLECGRRWGKSWFACVIAMMFAIQRPKSLIRYAAQTKDEVKKIILPLISEMLEDCPEHLRPTWHAQDGLYRFPNGSEWHIAGCDDMAAINRLRGTRTDLGIVDEGAYIADLFYLVHSVLKPQLLTTDGRMLILSSPPISPDHAFSDMCDEAESKGGYAHATVHDAPHVTEAMLEEYAAETPGGVNSPTWRREYLAERVVDSSRVIVPEFAELESTIVVESWPRPEHFHTWVGGDLGFVDLAVFALSYVDFRAGLVVIEDEVDAQRTKSTDINVRVARKERELGYVGERTPRARVIDAAAITVADMDERVNVRTGERASTSEVGPDIHTMRWVLANKDDADAALNSLRTDLGRYRIHRRCKTIIGHLKHGIWNKTRKSFDRVERAGVRHHFDGIDAVKYLNRHVDVRANPFPLLPKGVSPDTHHIPPMKRAMSAVFRGSRR